MANTYSQIYIQAVFAVKYREGLIHDSWKKELHAVIGNLINETGCQTIIVNGIEDHIHCFFCLKPKYSISEVMKNVKAKSSKWINENNLTPSRFEWQRGFGCFSYSQTQVWRVTRYIQNQEEHHRKRTFKDEYLEFLQNFKIDYDVAYLFHDPS